MNKKKEIKKILFCDNTLWGLVNFRGYIFTQLAQKGYSIVLVAPQSAESIMQIEVPKGVKYHSISINRCGKSPLEDIKYLIQLYKIYKKERPDYIFHYTIKPNIYGTIIANILGIRCSNMMAGLGYIFNSKDFLAKSIVKLYRFSMKKAEYIICLNSENKDIILKNRFCKQNNIILFTGGEGVDIQKFCSKNETISNSGTTTFLFVGRLLIDKGIRVLADAVRKLKQQHVTNFKCCAIGPIDLSYPGHIDEKEMKSYENEGLIEYLGHTNNIQKVLDQPDIVVVVPSFYPEGMNRSLMEACAMGKPIITTNIAGCKEMVDTSNGFLIPPKDPEALAEAMKKYLQLSKDKKKAFSVHSREKAEKVFNINMVLNEYIKILKQTTQN